MSALSEDQKSRMEESRRRALALRATKQKSPAQCRPQQAQTGKPWAARPPLSRPPMAPKQTSLIRPSTFPNNTGNSHPQKPFSNQLGSSPSMIRTSSSSGVSTPRSQGVHQQCSVPFTSHNGPSSSSSPFSRQTVTPPTTVPDTQNITAPANPAASVVGNWKGPRMQTQSSFSNSRTNIQGASDNTNLPYFRGSQQNVVNFQSVQQPSTAPLTSSTPGNASQCRNLHQSPHKMADVQPKLLQSTSPQKAPTNVKKVKGACVLVSRNRFKVEIGYCAPVIEVFKSMATKQYDAVEKQWLFELSEYHSLIAKLAQLSACVAIEPLPRVVLSTFAAQLRDGATCVHDRHIPQADLQGVDQTLVATLMPFQRDGVNFGLWRGGRVLIADDMGLGKTLQALCIVACYRKEWPLLIVAPSSVRFAWREQMLKWLPSVDPQEINVVTSGKESAVAGQVNILSYDLMVRCKKQLTDKCFGVIIMDESHFLKNTKTARTQVAVPLLKKARRVVLLSGTPALSRPSELYSQITAVDAKSFTYFQEFGVRYCAGHQMPWGWDFSGSSNLAELQILLEERIMIRRLKKDVLTQLPAKVRQMVVLDPGSVRLNKGMKASHSFVDRAKGNDRRGALLSYFHDTGAAKITAVREYVLDLLESERKFLVFAHHQEMLDALVEAVTKKNYSYIRIDGSTSSEQRNCLCGKFQTNDEVRVAVLSITAANAGLNLTAASMVVFAELFWNPGILVQAEDRAHRIGQEDSVSVQYLVATKTADDFIWPLVQAKLEVLSQAGLSKEDFRQADTKQLKDPKQREIMSMFEESFFEEEASGADDPEASASCHQSSTAPGAKQGNLLQFFKSDAAEPSLPEKKTDTSGVTAGEWTDDDDLVYVLDEVDDDDNPDAPWPKKPKLGLH